MNKFKLGIDIGSTTVKIAVLDDNNNILFSDYERHFANIQETLQSLLEKAVAELGEFEVYPVITGSGGLTLAKHLEVPFTQEVVAVSSKVEKLDVPIWQRYTMTIDEAAAYFHIGRARLRALVSEDPYAPYILMVGNRVQIKRKLFEEYLDSANAV